MERTKLNTEEFIVMIDPVTDFGSETMDLYKRVKNNEVAITVLIDRLWECDFSRDSIRMFVNNEWKNFSTFLPHLNGYIDELKCD